MIRLPSQPNGKLGLLVTSIPEPEAPAGGSEESVLWLRLRHIAVDGLDLIL
jgi:hypothetical protein